MSTVTIENVEPWRVFNLSLFESFILLDCRTEEKHSLSRIVTSISCPPPTGATNMSSSEMLESFCRILEDLSPENYSPIILIFDADQKSIKFAQDLSQLLCELLQDQLQSILSNQLIPEIRRHLFKRLGSCRKLWLIDFESFAMEFPSYCVSTMTFHDLGPTPRYICPELISGTRGCDLLDCIDRFRISHVVTHRDRELESRLGPGITYISYTVTDSLGEDLSSLWSAYSDLSMQVRDVGGRILLRVHGRAMTSACAAAYLIASGWPIDSALSHCSDAYQLPNILMEQQLRQWAAVRAAPRILDSTPATTFHTSAVPALEAPPSLSTDLSR